MKILKFAALASAIASTTAPALAGDDGFDKRFGSRQTSKSVIEAAQEVPVAGLPDPTDPVTGSKGLGNGIIIFDRPFRSAEVKVTFSNLSGAFTRLHLHCNESGSNGPIAIGIVDLVAIAQDNSEVATLDSNTVTGRITNNEFPVDDPCPGTIGRSVDDLRSLADAIDDGLIYWNLHSTAFPAGELRGQLEPLSGSKHRYDD